MQNAANNGLSRMQAVEQSITSLIVPPEEVLKPEARCPRPQCRITNKFLTKCYDTAARMGRVGNSLSHLMLALSQSSQSSSVDTSVQSLSDASLQAFAFMIRELWQLMSTLTLTCRQVWLAQSPLSESCRSTLCSLPVVPGELFGCDRLVAEKQVQGSYRFSLMVLQKNGQISALNGVTEEPPAEVNGNTDEKVLAEVGQTESVAVPQKEDSPETMEVLQDEVAPQVNGEKEETEMASADEVTTTEEEKSAQDSPQEASEVGFKKIFRFVGFKFTVKKDKNEKAEPVQLLTVKKEEEAEASNSEMVEESKEDVPKAEEEQPAEEQKAAEEPAVSEPTAEPVTDKTATEKVNGVATEQVSKEETEQVSKEETEQVSMKEEPTEEVSQEKEPEPAAESDTAPAVQETQSSFRRFFTQGIFSNLRKRTSFKKSKEEEAPKDKAPEEEIKEAEEAAEPPAAQAETTKEEVAEEAEQEVFVTPTEADKELASQVEPVAEEGLITKVEIASGEEAATKVEGSTEEPHAQIELTAEVEAPVAVEQEQVMVESEAPPTGSEEVTEAQPAEVSKAAEDSKPQEENAESSPENEAIVEEAPAGEPELSASQEKAKVQGSPLKKLFSGSGLKKISSRKHKAKRDAEAKLTESGEQVTDQLQSSTESAEGQKGESSPSSPEESGEHIVSEASHAEASQENDGEATTSDGEKKKDGILPWASFKKLVTPKKRVKRPSESEDESGEKPKSATLSSTESAEKPEEPKACEEDQKVKVEDKADESAGAEPLSSDGEIPKEESTFSLKKLIPGRRKKKTEGKQALVSSDEVGKDAGSAEEDSDTPAVVPLSEYDNVEPEQVQVLQTEEAVTAKVADTTEAEAVKPEQEPEVKPSEVVPATAADERSPSWISASVVEEIQESTTECITKHQQLSDIPEEGDTVATPKSTTEDVSRDDTIADDFVDLTLEAVTAVEQAPEMSIAEETTEMVSAVSRLTESPRTSGETTPVPGEGEEKKTEALLQEVVEASCVKLHEPSEATTICTGLESQEIESVEEKMPKASIESATELSEAMTTEVVVEDKTKPSEVAVIADEMVQKTVAEEIKLDVQESVTEPVAEVTIDQAAEVGHQKEEAEPEVLEELQEAQPISIAVVNTVQEGAEHIEAIVVSEDTPKIQEEGPADITVEALVCSQISQISEISTLEGKEKQEPDDEQQSSADAKLAPMDEVVEAATQEMITSLSEPLATAEVQEALIPDADSSEVPEKEVAVSCLETEVEVASVEVPVIEELPAEVKVVDELSAEVSVEGEIKAVSTSESVIEEQVRIVEKEPSEVTVDSIVEGEIESASTIMTTVVQEVCEMVEEVKESVQAEQGEEESIEEQSTVIVQTVIQSVVENLSETVKEPESLGVQEAEAEEAAAETSNEVKEKLEAVEVSEEKKPVVTEKLVEQIASVDVESEHKQVVEVEVKEEVMVEAEVLDEQIEKATECLEGATQVSGETKSDDTSEGKDETEKPGAPAAQVEQVQSESEETEKEKVPRPETSEVDQPSEDIPAEKVEVTEETPSEDPVTKVLSQTAVVADAITQLETKETPSLEEASDITAKPEPVIEAQTADLQLCADTAEAKTEEGTQKEMTEAAPSDQATEDAPGEAKTVAQVTELQTETVEKPSSDSEIEQGRDDALPAVSQEQVDVVSEMPVEEAQIAETSATKKKETEQEKETSTTADIVKHSETTVQKQATEMTLEVEEETVMEIEPMSTELTAAS
ncbi:hypothetical protein GJAV_G00116910 [Gymnothorax javanicus]|nr:hypothetical protein GJAV_G00116910 [Gymnothorax javanicus]